MSYDVPARFERQIQEYAHALHISQEEAVTQLLQAGLKLMSVVPSHAPISPHDILGAFSSPEERANADEALELAMKDRERRNSRAPHA